MSKNNEGIIMYDFKRVLDVLYLIFLNGYTFLGDYTDEYFSQLATPEHHKDTICYLELVRKDTQTGIQTILIDLTCRSHVRNIPSTRG